MCVSVTNVLHIYICAIWILHTNTRLWHIYTSNIYVCMSYINCKLIYVSVTYDVRYVDMSCLCYMYTAHIKCISGLGNNILQYYCDVSSHQYLVQLYFKSLLILLQCIAIYILQYIAIALIYISCPLLITYVHFISSTVF